MLGAEFICAALLVAGPGAGPAGPGVAAVHDAQAFQTHPSQTQETSPAVAHTVRTPDGRSAQLIDLGAPGGDALLERIATELPAATSAVTAFWGPRWREDIAIVVAGSPEQFAVLAGGDADIAATTTVDRITFSPRAAGMSQTDLRTVLRHELFHYAARADTAPDAPVWLTEGVADFVGRPAPAVPPTAPPTPPTDAELATPGPGRSAAYDRAWEFATYIAHTYGVDKLRAFYIAAGGHDRTDARTAARDVLGADLVGSRGAAR
ncbi:Peptidase [Mycobacterium sp. smrl_JER01]